MKPTEAVREAVLWGPAEGGRVHCWLCNFQCRIAEGKLGHCCVRKNIGGKLYSLNYDKVCAANPDPIEKKPLFHFLPGSRSFSIAAVGCNFRCEFCQNWQISQAALETGRIEGEAAHARADRGRRGPDRLQEHRVHVHRADHFHGAGRRLRRGRPRSGGSPTSSFRMAI